MSNGSNWEQPPAPDELEISVFGPGYGECIVAHLGLGDWIVVDSCLDGETRRAQALSYLEGLRLDPESAIKSVIATHWHDDHIGGIGELFQTAKSADFWCSMALNSHEWLTLVELQNHALLKCGSGVREMRCIMDELRKRKGENGIAAPRFAIEGRPIFSRSTGVTASVEAFAPSDAAVQTMHAEFVRLRSEAARRIGRVPSLGPNDGSVVLSLRVGDLAVLLGADLEERGVNGLGWTAVLSHVENSCVRHEGFKVPHHGSPTAHHPAVWPNMMTDTAWAVVTPWRRGSGLPTESDSQRVLRESRGNAYVTAHPRRTKYKHPDSAVNRTLREMGATLYRDIGKQGHVRFRRRAVTPDSWRTELFGSASRLADVQWA